MPNAVITQVPSIILPTVWSVGTEVENIDDLLAHTSLEFDTSYLQEKIIHVMAIEVLPFGGVPGPLWLWVEVSPVLSTLSALYWSAIGGGGGVQVGGVPVIPPLVPTIEVAAGAHLRTHTIVLPWVIHSPYCRLVAWTPVAAGLPLAQWAIQALVSGKAA